MRHDIRHEVQGLENVISVCFGSPRGDDLPQIGGENDMVLDTLQDCSGKTMHLIDAEIHHQVETLGD